MIPAQFHEFLAIFGCIFAEYVLKNCILQFKNESKCARQKLRLYQNKPMLNTRLNSNEFSVKLNAKVVEMHLMNLIFSNKPLCGRLNNPLKDQSCRMN